MFRKGHFALKTIYYHGRKQWLAINTARDSSYHTHIPYSKQSAARMIVVRAAEGKIPDNYPHWMVVSINRLWYGKDTTREDKIKQSNQY